MREPGTREKTTGRGRRRGAGERWSKERGEEKEKKSITVSPLINVFSVSTEDTQRERAT